MFIHFLQKERTDSFPKFDISSARLGHPPGLQTHHTQGTEASPSYSSHGKNGPMADRSNNDQNHIISSKMIDSLLADKDDGTDDLLAPKLPPTSAPNSPRARPRDNEDLKLYHSAPVTPLHADINLPKNLPPAQQNRVAEPVSGIYLKFLVLSVFILDCTYCTASIDHFHNDVNSFEILLGTSLSSIPCASKSQRRELLVATYRYFL